MPSTAAGTPYVDPGDAVADYPTVSRALAEAVDAHDAADRAAAGAAVDVQKGRLRSMSADQVAVWQGGTRVVTTDANGVATVSLVAPSTDTKHIIAVANTETVAWILTVYRASGIYDFQIRLWDATGAVVPNRAVGVSFIVIG